LLSNRLIEMKSNERILLEMTLLIWVLGMSLGFFLFIKMWNTQKVLWSTVSSQTQLLEKNDKLTMLGEMAAGVAHEIASPIQIILFANYKLANFTEFNQSEILKYTGQIDKMLSQIKFIVKSIKAFSHHSEQTETVSIDLKNSLDEALMIVQFKIKEHRVIIDIDPSVQKFKVMATEPELVQIFVNLINNSVDALSNQTDRIIKISATQNENKWVEIHVADNGPGVPVNKREKIFETLFTTKKYGKGTGIGLSLSRKIAESHGGQLILESSEIGADFKIILSEG
jgi:C4-dicarboxylate-specific signal transduction histidine kinase